MTNMTAPQIQRGRKKEEDPAELPQGIGGPESNIRALDALAHAVLAGAEAKTAPAAQPGVGTENGASGGTLSAALSRPPQEGGQGGDKLMSAEVHAPSSLRPSGGTGNVGGSAPKMEYREIKEAAPSAGTVYQQYLSTYDGRKDRLMDRLEREQFSYDPATDPEWQAYQKQYRREGQRASEDALGRAAATTGGVPSSYAVSAAAQAENNYAAKLSDRFPEVYRSAYSRYLQEFERLLSLADTYERYAGKENEWQRALREYEDRLRER